MAIVKMKKLTIVVSDSVSSSLLNELQMLDSVHIDVLNSQASEEGGYVSDVWAADLKDVPMEYSNLEENKKELAAALHNIEEITQVKIPKFEVTSVDTLEKIRQKYDFDQVARDLKELDKKTKHSASMLEVLNNELESVERWSSVVPDFDPLFDKDPFLKGVVGHVSDSVFEIFKSDIIQETELSEVLPAWVEEGEVYCYVVAHREVWDKVLSVIKNHPFNTLSVTKRSGKTDQMIEDLKREIEQLNKNYSEAVSKWKTYAENISDLTLIHDILEMDAQLQKASAMALQTDTVQFFRAWVPENFMPKVEAILSIYNKSIDVTIENPIEEEYDQVPVFLSNNSLTKPFAVLTNMYGTPMYGTTVDPTPHLSIFYFIYYGMCLGDALYGALMVLFSSFMVLKNRANHSLVAFYSLLIWSGFSAVIAGVLFGSYAGNLFTDYIPIPALQDLSFRFADGSSFFDKPLVVLFVSLFLGALQLWYGYWIKFIVSLKNNGINALFDDFPWIILLTGFFGWAVFSWIAGMAGLELVSEQQVSLFFVLMKVGAGLIILNSMRKGFQKGFVSGILGPLAGAWELYGISGYLSNLLSYARLLALGLSSGIIANVFNQLCFDMINGLSSINPILSIFGILMLFVLHLFNLVLGGFGAFVHALRLQFVEFFGQFMQGGGKDYKPLARQGSHYTVK
ncbi:MAG: V-type ATP synthase subunit I [Brevinemataceae bacterium]